MAEYKFDTDYLEVGDIFEGGPIEQSYFISVVMGVGGKVEIDGNKVVILQLPKKEVSKAKASDSSVAKEAPKAEAPKAEAPKAEVPKFNVKPGPKPKAPPTPEKNKE